MGRMRRWGQKISVGVKVAGHVGTFGRTIFHIMFFHTRNKNFVKMLEINYFLTQLNFCPQTFVKRNWQNNQIWVNVQYGGLFGSVTFKVVSLSL